MNYIFLWKSLCISKSNFHHTQTRIFDFNDIYCFLALHFHTFAWTLSHSFCNLFLTASYFLFKVGRPDVWTKEITTTIKSQWITEHHHLSKVSYQYIPLNIILHNHLSSQKIQVYAYHQGSLKCVRNNTKKENQQK